MKATATPELVWYASYGSNLSRGRFQHYLQGGRPRGASRTYRGARDDSLPVDDRGLTVPGGILFGMESSVWGGGMAFYDPHGAGRARMRAYLITVGQFSDVVAQEMRRETGADLDLSCVLAHGRDVIGLGRYETLRTVGEIDGSPVVTFTDPAPSAIDANSPAPAYVRMLAHGLRESHALTVTDVCAYLLACRGMGAWDEARLAACIAEPDNAETSRAEFGAAWKTKQPLAASLRARG